MTFDQMKSALFGALAFIFSACLALAVFLYSDKKADEAAQSRRLSLVSESLVGFARENGWEKTKAALLQHASVTVGDRPHVWLLSKDKSKPLDEAAAFPAELALRALSKPDRSIRIEGSVAPTRLHVTSADLEDKRLLVGLQAEIANQWIERVIYAVFASCVVGSIAAFAAVFWASRRSNRRINDIKSTISAFLSGDLTNRVLFPGPVDSLYELAHGVNRVLRHAETQAEILDSLASDIAHNLRKPLTRLRTRLEAARDADDVATRYRAHADRAARNLDDMIKIFDAQLNIRQFQAGSGRARFQNVDLGALIAHIIATYESIVADSGKTLRASLPEQVPSIRGNAGLIMEMVVNIIENAIQHCPARTTISVSLIGSNEVVSIILSDDGPGVPAEAVDAVLQRFMRLDTTRPGHGIGLPFAAAVAELHNAAFELADNGPGLKITISFPADSSSLTPQLGLRMRSGLKLKLQIAAEETPDRAERSLQGL